MADHKNKPKKQWKEKKPYSATSYGHQPQLSLSEFRSTDVPDFSCLKFIYSDFRTLVSVLNQGEYVYRLNSLFDPDQTGVGGQPDGFDQWKALYQNYRVVAAHVCVEFICTSALVGLATMAPTSAVAGIGSAEEAGGLRHARTAPFTNGILGKMKAMYHMNELVGYTPEAVLGDNTLQSSVTTNPTNQQYLHVCTETGGATDSVNMYVKITYFTRMELPTPTIDTFGHRRRRNRLFGGAQPVVAAPEVLAAQQTPALCTSTLGTASCIKTCTCPHH